jgi:hypothetical protein
VKPELNTIDRLSPVEIALVPAEVTHRGKV